MTGLFTPGRGIAAANLGGRGVLTPIQNILKSLRDFFKKTFLLKMSLTSLYCHPEEGKVRGIMMFIVCFYWHFAFLLKIFHYQGSQVRL